MHQCALKMKDLNKSNNKMKVKFKIVKDNSTVKYKTEQVDQNNHR